MKFSIQELVIILVIVIVIFGPTQLPKLAKMFGKGAKKVKKNLDEAKEKAESSAAQDDDDEI